MIVVAHASHWLISVIYAAPVVGILAWVAISTVRSRRRDADEDDGGERS